MENNRLIQELVNIFDNMGINEKKIYRFKGYRNIK